MISILSAEQRLNRPRKINMTIFGPSGIGKTFLARTLPDAGQSCLFLDLEAGMSSINDDIHRTDGSVVPKFAGGSIDIRRGALEAGITPWEFARAIACLLAGPDPSLPPTSPYSQAAYNYYREHIADPAIFQPYNIIFGDSITVASRHCFSWASQQEESFSDKKKDKNGNPAFDTRGAYGLMGREMVRWLTQLQHIPDKSVILVGILDMIEDEIPGRYSYQPQIEGSKTGRELPGIFDQVMSLMPFTIEGEGAAAVAKLDPKNGTTRILVCQSNSGFGVPAKDRTGRLAMLEPPDLGAIMAKLASGQRVAEPVSSVGVAA